MVLKQTLEFKLRLEEPPSVWR
jgi:hypothetical protein